MLDQKLNCSFHFAALFSPQEYLFHRQQRKRNFCPAWLCSLCGELPLLPLLLFHQANVRPWRWFWISLQAPGVCLTFHKILLASTRSLCSSRILKCIGCFFELRCFPFLKFIFDFCNRMWYNVFSISSSITARQRIYLSEGKTI